MARSAGADVRAMLLLNEYRKRRDEYEHRAKQLRLAYNDAAVARLTRDRMHRLDIRPRPAAVGGIHTLAWISTAGWHGQLLKSLGQLGKVTHFDPLATGIDYQSLRRGLPDAILARRKACAAFEALAAKAASEHPIHWVFVYASGIDLLRETIDRIREITGAPVVGIGLDDKQTWSGQPIGEQLSGMVGIASKLDLAWTSARIACEWYLCEGGNPVYLPEGCDANLYSPGDQRQDLDLCFVGQAYGLRPNFTAALHRLGLTVATAGYGWQEGTMSEAELVNLVRRSRIVLGMGGIGWSDELKNLKGRDFDGPAVGTSAYLTSYNPELTQFFEIGREIVCYSSLDECYEIARWLLADEQGRKKIAQQGRERCLREHTWLHRFARLLEILGVFGPQERRVVDRLASNSPHG
jgi:hypothetical protein